MLKALLLTIKSTTRLEKPRKKTSNVICKCWLVNSIVTSQNTTIQKLKLTKNGPFDTNARQITEGMREELTTELQDNRNCKDAFEFFFKNK